MIHRSMGYNTTRSNTAMPTLPVYPVSQCVRKMPAEAGFFILYENLGFVNMKKEHCMEAHNRHPYSVDGSYFRKELHESEVFPLISFLYTKGLHLRRSHSRF